MGYDLCRRWAPAEPFAMIISASPPTPARRSDGARRAMCARTPAVLQSAATTISRLRRACDFAMDRCRRESTSRSTCALRSACHAQVVPRLLRPRRSSSLSPTYLDRFAFVYAGSPKRSRRTLPHHAYRCQPSLRDDIVTPLTRARVLLQISRRGYETVLVTAAPK